MAVSLTRNVSLLFSFIVANILKDLSHAIMLITCLQAACDMPTDWHMMKAMIYYLIRVVSSWRR